MLPLFKHMALATAAALALTACGGGGGGATTTNTAAATATATATAATVAALTPTATVVPTETPEARQALLSQLGRQIFTDRDLSEPRGTACVACHQADQGFAGNHGSRTGVALGSQAGALGIRNAMTNSYQGLVPAFGFITEGGKTEAVGGHFWDGRADTLALQALGPLLNPLEMNNPSREAVVAKIAASTYADTFKRAFGANIFANTDAAFTQIGEAIAAFELANLQPFNSKYDAMVRGQATFTPAESRGMAVFQNPNRANCAGCHLMNATSGNPADSPFSEFTYYATGVPRNTAIAENANPTFYDLGLCGPNRSVPALPATVAPGTTANQFCGQFRMPTLRNVAERPAYMHNGVFKTLREVVAFYATRNSNPQRWYGPTGVANDLPARYLANLEVTKAPFNRLASEGPALTEVETDDLIAFLHTLSDGYVPPTAATTP